MKNDSLRPGGHRARAGEQMSTILSGEVYNGFDF